MKYQYKDKLIDFNAEWVASQKVDDFIAHESHHGLTKTQLREIHKLCKISSSNGSFESDDAPQEAP